MNKFFATLISSLIFNKKKRKALRDKLITKIKIPKGNVFESNRSIIGKVLVFGKGNKIIFSGTSQDPIRLKIHIHGNNNTIEIGENVTTPECTTISIGTSEFPCNDASFSVGESTQFNGVNFRLMENGSKIEIGKKCLFSWDIEVWATDSHSILNEVGEVTNLGHQIIIGDHVWVGMSVKIGKNVIIGSNCVIGWGSVVTKKFPKGNCIIAGNPACIVKTDVSWDPRAPNHANMHSPKRPLLSL